MSGNGPQSPWPMVTLDDVLSPVRRETAVSPDSDYPLLGVRWYAKGLFRKETKSGKVQSLTSKIDEARELRAAADSATDSLTASLRKSAFSELDAQYPSRALGDLIAMRSGEGLTSRQMDDAAPHPVYGGGGLTGRSNYLFEDPKVVIGRVGARCGCVFVTEPNAWITDNALYLTAVSDDLELQYLVNALTMLDLRHQANHAAQPVVSQKKINPLKIPLPPLSVQRRVLARLTNDQEQIAKVIADCQQAGREMDALRPAILDRAFKGQL